MDWLTFKFCVLILVFVSKARSQELNSTSSLSHSNQSQSACEEGRPVPSPDECNSCICFAGLVYCSNSTCAEQECINDDEIPQPDPCNTCICRRGKVTCTNLICIPAPNCVEKQLYPPQNECNACMCLNGYISCTSNGCTEENLSDVTPKTTTTTKTPRKSKKCIEGSHLPGPNKCVECSCVNGKKKCTNICTPSAQLENRFGDTSKRNECVSGQSIPKPDDCNNCICFEGEVHCTHRPCHKGMREGQECRDDQPVIRPDECNECYCLAGKLQCSNVVCIRGSKCVHDQEIPKPDRCNACKCIEGHILCTNNPCPALDTRNAFTPEKSSTEVTVESDECQDGDVIPPLPPPYECNTCFCIEKKILCTMISCVDSDPEIKGRLKEENEPNHLQMFDKQISVEPFIDILYKNNDKIPTKVIHTHAYNGFHQEIKVHANHLPKDATGLLKALATSLDNSALASISQKLLTSSDSLSNNQEVNKNSLLGEGNMFTTQSSKLIASGSQSNETILVIPDTESFGSEYPPSVLPVADKHETIWKTVSVPASAIYHDNKIVQPRSSQEENLNFYHDNRPPIIHSIQHSDMIRNPSKFNRPGLPRTFPINPKPDTLELSNVNTLPNPMLNPTPISINSGNINYAPLYQENNQFKPVPSGFGSKPTIPGHTPIFNYTLPSSGFGPVKHITTPNVNSGQQKQSQPQFVPNPTKYYFNQVKPQEFQFKPNQKRPTHIIITNSDNKGMQYPPLFPNTPNQPILSANQYNPSQFGLKPGQGNFLNNIGNQTDQNFKQFSPNFQIPPVINLPEQNKRISGFEIQTSKEKPINSMSEINSPQKGVEHTQQKPIHSQYIPNPSIYYKHEYEAPKINEINPDAGQLLPHSKLPFTFTERYNKSHTYSEPDFETIIPKVRNKTKKYNTTHSHYEKHTSVTYLSDYDPDDPIHPKIVGHEPSQDHNAPQTNEFDHYLSDQESQGLDSIISKVIPLDQKDSPKSNHYNPSQTSIIPSITDINNYNQPHSPDDRENTDQIIPNLNRTLISVNPYISTNYKQIPSEFQLMLPVGNAQKENLNEPDGSQSPRNSDEYPTHLKSNEHLHRPSEIGSIQNQPPGFQYAHNANQEPLQQKPVNKFPTSGFQSPQNNHLPGMLHERGSADGFQYPSHFAEDLTHYDPAHPKDNLHITPQSQLAPTQDKHKPGMIDKHGIKDGYQYAHNANQNPAHLKPMYELSDFLFSPTSNQQKPETPDDDGSSGGFQYTSNSAGNPKHSRGNLDNPQKPQLSPNQIQYPSKSADHPLNPKGKTQMPLNLLFGPTPNQKLQEVIDDRGSAGGFRYPSNTAEKSIHPTDHLHNSLYPNENSHRPFLPLFDFIQDKYSPDFHYPTNSTKNIQQPNSLYGPIQNQHLPEIFEERVSPDGFQYPSHSVGNPLHQKQPNSLYGSTKNQHSPEIFDDRGSSGGFQYPSHPAENPSHEKQPNSLYGPTQNQHSPRITDDRGSAAGFQYPSNSVENPSHQQQPNPPYGPNKNQNSPGIPESRGTADDFQYPSQPANNPSHQKQPNSLNGPTQNHHSPGITDDRGSAGGFQYPSNSVENPSHQKQPNSPYGPNKNQHSPGIPDSRGSADGFQYPSHPANNPSHQKQPNSLNGPTQNQHSPRITDDHGSAGGFQYPSNSVENPLHQQQPNSLNGPTQNHHSPGITDDHGSAGGFQYPSNSVENPSHQKQPNSPYVPNKNQHSPGIPDSRGSADGFQYPSHPANNPSHQKQPNSLNGPAQNSPGITDDRGSAGGFQYPSNSVENPSHQQQPNSPYGPNKNQHSPGIPDSRGSADGFKYPSHPVNNPSHQQQPNSLNGPTQNQHSPGITDDHGSAGGFQYPSNSVENPSHQKQPNTPYVPIKNQNLPGVFNDRGSAGGFQYPSDPAENPSDQKQPNSLYGPTHNQHSPGQHSTNFQYPTNSTKNIQQPNSLYGPIQNQHLPEIFEERGSPDGFQYPSHSAENLSHQKQPNSPYGPVQNQHSPGILDERGSVDGFQYPSHSTETTTTNPKDKLIDSPFNHIQDKHLIEIFGERGSTNGFQYPAHSTESPLQIKDNRHRPLQYQFLPSHDQYKDTKKPDSLFSPDQNKHLPGMFNENGPSDGFQYPSHAVESPLQTKDNRHHPLQSQFLPSHNQYKDTIHKQPDSIISPNQNKHSPSMFDEHGSPDGFQYPSHSVGSPLQTKDNQHNPLQSQFLPSHNQYKDTIHKQPDSSFGNTNKHPAEDPANSKAKLSHSPVTFTHNQHSPSFYYPSHSADNLSHQDKKQPNTPYGLTQNQYLPIPFDKRQSSTAENPISSNANIHNVPRPYFNPTQKSQNNSIHKKPEFPFNPTQIHDLPEVFEEISQSTEDPTYSKHVPDKTPISEFTLKIYDKKVDQPDQIPDLYPISPTSNNYNNNNPLRPWIHLDHDQYKPSSFDNLLNGIHNIPWSLPDDHKEMSNIVSSTPQVEFGSDRDQYKPLSLDNLHNGVHDISLPEHHEKVLNTITSAPKARLKPEHDQYKPWSYDNSLNGIHQIPWPIPNQDSDVLVTDAEITTPRYTNSDNTQFNSHPETKPDSDPDKVLAIDDDEIPNDYDQLYPLLNIVKKLSELPFNESALTVDQLDLLPKLLSGITKTLNYDPENDHNNALPVENNDVQKISPWSKIKSKFKQLPISGNGVLNWFKNKLNKVAPIKPNITAIIKDIDMTKIFNLLTKLKGPKINDNAVPQNISFSSFDFEEDNLTTTSLPRTDATHSYDNRIKTVPIDHEENRTQAPQVKYPDVHIILHQPNDQNDLDLPPFIETDGLGNLATDINSEELGTLFPKKFNPRFRHRPKDQKEECGDGTYWISNCHGCSCYFGQPMCFKIPDCKLRSFGEPMPCKPYSHFKMGCYTCECNGDGVAECDAKDCEPKLSGESIVSETTTIRPPESNEFFDSKQTDEILQYYYTYKKLPKYCPKTQNPTCEPSTSWISSCHKCECNETGKHECIKIDGCKLDFESYGKPSRCKPNSKFYPKTNSVPCVECSCDDEGKSHCPSAEQKH